MTLPTSSATSSDPSGPCVGDLFVGCEKPGENVPRRTRWAAVLERHEDDGVAAQRAAIPGAVLADHHAVRKARQRACRHPAQAERCGMPAKRIVRLNRLSDHGRVLWHAVIDR